MWLLVEYPGSDVCVLFRVAPLMLDVEAVKRGWRKMGGRVVAVYRRKHSEPYGERYGIFD